MINDVELEDRITRAMLLDSRLSAHPVAVTVKNGIVTLEGWVQTFRRKLVAQGIASSFEGCRQVINSLEVRPPEQIPDTKVATYVRRALRLHADLARESITVSVKEGMVLLKGSVASQWERTIAEDVSRSAIGVRDVQNLLIIDPAAVMENVNICEEIKAVLSQTRGLRDEQIDVALGAGTLVLSGSVKELWRKETAESVANRFGLLRIRNDIIVNHTN